MDEGLMKMLFRKLLFLSLIAVVVSPASIGSATTISRNVNDYVLFALDKINYKRGKVNGNVGVNSRDPINHGAHLTFGGRVRMPDGTYVVAESVRIDDSSDLFDVYANSQLGGFSGGRNSGPGNFPIPFLGPIVDPADVLTQLGFPSAFDQDDPLNNIAVEKNGTLALAPGAYGELRVRNGATLILEDGVYNVSSFTHGKYGNIIWTDGTVINVTGDVHFGDGANYSGGMATLRVGGDVVGFGRRTEFEGKIHALSANCGLGAGTLIIGQAVCKQIHTDNNVTISTTPIPEPSSIALTTVGFLTLAAYGLRKRQHASHTH